LTRIEPAGNTGARVGVALTLGVGTRVGTGVFVGSGGLVAKGIGALWVGKTIVGTGTRVGVGVGAPPQPTSALPMIAINPMNWNDERGNIRTFLSAGSPHPYHTTIHQKNQLAGKPR
jgi:hypothetical protein